ncbi:MAG: 2-hydroxyacid dehydrogenase [Verrucomicrobia bacterium]|nr:2-hydroxyacid dehydrogenase [Verrucomicrobiota bacterium]MDA1069368.1 2-hydroxyacid dehydrogenase [Verrucomicrobiota bacterium]
MKQNTPIKILTPYRVLTHENWPGETPVEFHYADDEAGMAAKMPEVDVVLSMYFTKAMGAMAGPLKLVQCAGIGFDKIDRDAVPEDCPIANVSEHDNAIAEWVLMVMLAMEREMIQADQAVRSGNWDRLFETTQWSMELRQRTLAIIGLGQIGRRTAELAKVFGMRLIAATRTIPSDGEATQLGLDAINGMDDLDRVLEQADFVMLSLPLNKSTEGLIGEHELALMKPTACLINVARAKVVVEEALFDALQRKQIKAAALDVWYNEPDGPGEMTMPASCPFWKLDNVIMAPHASSLTTGMLARKLQFMAQNIDRLARGEKLKNIIA